MTVSRNSEAGAAKRVEAKKGHGFELPWAILDLGVQVVQRPSHGPRTHWWELSYSRWRAEREDEDGFGGGEEIPSTLLTTSAVKQCGRERAEVVRLIDRMVVVVVVVVIRSKLARIVRCDAMHDEGK